MHSLSLLAGAARVDITPPLGTIINGDFVRHYARYIHDPLYAKALVLQNQEITLAIVIVDICVMPKDFLDEVKAGIAARTGIPYTHILISSTHTHAAGSIADVHLVGADLGYRKKLPGLLVESVVKAKEKVRPAQVAFGSVAVPEHVVCRRYIMKDGYKPVNPVTDSTDTVKTNPIGAESWIDQRAAPTDPEVSFLAVQDTAGNWISLLANYSLHYVGDWENGTISADYFGVFSEQIRQRLDAGDDFVGIMSNGTSGDVNIWDFLKPDRYPNRYFEKSKLIGSDIAARVANATENLEWHSAPVLEALYQELPLAVNKPGPAELERAIGILEQSDYENVFADEAGLRSIYAREQILLNEFPDEAACPVQALRIGNGVVGGLPGEFFAETGLWLKAQSPVQHYFTISLANGNAGYVPPPDEISRGGYETWRCRISCLEAEAERKIREALLRQILALSDAAVQTSRL
ncbi:neutral/alkaline non-lysosomal ceramidase N-terminal domain-containing protein [Nibrella saemangeumensis]|uniref:Neutral/alkaline non-lysosomal ceramidase N-terminal domain-containing protein n=1 Tax=Nibrella saemangeumensis TaxID=1084526 RepID=A0ABP8NDD7_9BACT